MSSMGGMWIYSGIAQYVLMYHPHWHLSEFSPLPNSTTAAHLHFFVSAAERFSNTWGTAAAVTDMLELEGHRKSYILTITAYVQTLHDVLPMCSNHVLCLDEFSTAEAISSHWYTLDVVQQSVLKHVQTSLHQQHEYYDQLPAFHDGNSNSSPVKSNTPTALDWRKYIIVRGVAGTGKTHVIHTSIHSCIANGYAIFVATPTGKLATEYRAKFDNQIDADTIHSAFYYSVASRDVPTTNWSLSAFNVIILNEASMVRFTTASQIFCTIEDISIRPLVIIYGHEAQQQPFEEHHGHTCTVPSMLQHPYTQCHAVRFTLVTQHCCEDPAFLDILNLLRHWDPSEEQ